jgi:hypothetical protein
MEVVEWARAAGLTSEPVVHLPGGKLTVTLWLAKRPALSRSAAA